MYTGGWKDRCNLIKVVVHDFWLITLNFDVVYFGRFSRLCCDCHRIHVPLILVGSVKPWQGVVHRGAEHFVAASVPVLFVEVDFASAALGLAEGSVESSVSGDVGWHGFAAFLDGGGTFCPVAGPVEAALFHDRLKTGLPKFLRLVYHRYFPLINRAPKKTRLIVKVILFPFARRITSPYFYIIKPRFLLLCLPKRVIYLWEINWPHHFRSNNRTQRLRWLFRNSPLIHRLNWLVFFA